MHSILLFKQFPVNIQVLPVSDPNPFTYQLVHGPGFRMTKATSEEMQKEFKAIIANHLLVSTDGCERKKHLTTWNNHLTTTLQFYIRWLWIRVMRYVLSFHSTLQHHVHFRTSLYKRNYNNSPWPQKLSRGKWTADLLHLNFIWMKTEC